ncbi:hypothetical protein GEA64_20145 [Photorhabdus khanii]|uniref:Uncharacterized protein n=5 Tax=Morganellaceae TaxID=1903414 RepID=A0A7C9GMD4_9GAMM|nr:hypothetical protein [Photorhabdus khanii]NHB98764.1 hypothetical protein [Photorhabdus stackebrandtii]RAW93217.1 hypothetical protein CKY03_22310 [Photorhabdus sp. S9-53]RAW93280.1 hypothetical protein CKY05_22245 [Photorhabdus sp. S10-54]RAW96865.1 hypothetical protein CKY04_22180 [Photorhabdus sp. S8-52]TDB44151.1 hypothetical protein C5468_22910 [Photorhabdus luminescens subsp. mexicana]TNH41516.1 hypothetical protein EP164_22180 [Photorhabdus luminescens subsp. sonorensis]
MEIIMIFGDPNHFAILIEYLSDWSTENGYRNGLFHFCIDGKLYPNSAKVATLGGDILCLSDSNALVLPVENNNIFNMEKKEAYFSMLKTMLPERAEPEKEVSDDFVTSYKYQASTYNLENDCCYVFAVSNGSMIRILGAKLSVLNGNDDVGYHWEEILKPHVTDIILEKETVKNIVTSTINYYYCLK